VKDSPSRKRTDKAEEAQSNIEPSQQELFKWNPLVNAKYDDWIFILLIHNVNTISIIGSSVQRRKNESFFTLKVKGEID
jgi:U3 small nucleolar RNA-associated protein 14